MSLDWIPTNWIVHPCRKQGFISSTQKKKDLQKNEIIKGIYLFISLKKGTKLNLGSLASGVQ